jgi:dipeptidyl-peptidase 4
LLFLRALAADDPATALWSLDLGVGEERLLADPRVLLAGAAEVIPAAELRRRERLRESARGIVAYSTDSAGRVGGARALGPAVRLRPGDRRHPPGADRRDRAAHF